MRARGQGNICDAAWEWTEPTAGERTAARGMGWVGVFREIQSGWAFRRFPAVSSAHPYRAFGGCLRFGSEWWRGKAGGLWFLESSGCRGLAGSGASAARHGSGQGPRLGSGLRPAAWDGFGILRGIEPCRAFRCLSGGPAANLLGAPMLCTFGTSGARPLRFLLSRLGVDGARRRKVLECLWGAVALRARGQGSVCGLAWEWAGPTPGERAKAHGMGWVRFFVEFNQAAPCGVSLSRLTADSGCTFQGFPAGPHGISMPRFPALACCVFGPPPCCAFGSSLPFGPGKLAVVRGVGVSGVSLGVAGSRAGERLWRGMGVGGAHGRGAGCGPRHGVGSGFPGS